MGLSYSLLLSAVVASQRLMRREDAATPSSNSRDHITAQPSSSSAIQALSPSSSSSVKHAHSSSSTAKNVVSDPGTSSSRKDDVSHSGSSSSSIKENVNHPIGPQRLTERSNSNEMTSLMQEMERETKQKAVIQAQKAAIETTIVEKPTVQEEHHTSISKSANARSTPGKSALETKKATGSQVIKQQPGKSPNQKSEQTDQIQKGIVTEVSEQLDETIKQSGTAKQETESQTQMLAAAQSTLSEHATKSSVRGSSSTIDKKGGSSTIQKTKTFSKAAVVAAPGRPAASSKSRSADATAPSSIDAAVAPYTETAQEESTSSSSPSNVERESRASPRSSVSAEIPSASMKPAQKKPAPTAGKSGGGMAASQPANTEASTPVNARQDSQLSSDPKMAPTTEERPGIAGIAASSESAARVGSVSNAATVPDGGHVSQEVSAFMPTTETSPMNTPGSENGDDSTLSIPGGTHGSAMESNAAHGNHDGSAIQSDSAQRSAIQSDGTHGSAIQLYSKEEIVVQNGQKIIKNVVGDDGLDFSNEHVFKPEEDISKPDSTVSSSTNAKSSDSHEAQPNDSSLLDLRHVSEHDPNQVKSGTGIIEKDHDYLIHEKSFHPRAFGDHISEGLGFTINTLDDGTAGQSFIELEKKGYKQVSGDMEEIEREERVLAAKKELAARKAAQGAAKKTEKKDETKKDHITNAPTSFIQLPGQLPGMLQQPFYYGPDQGAYFYDQEPYIIQSQPEMMMPMMPGMPPQPMGMQQQLMALQNSGMTQQGFPQQLPQQFQQQQNGGTQQQQQQYGGAPQQPSSNQQQTNQPAPVSVLQGGSTGGNQVGQPQGIGQQQSNSMTTPQTQPLYAQNTYGAQVLSQYAQSPQATQQFQQAAQNVPQGFYGQVQPVIPQQQQQYYGGTQAQQPRSLMQQYQGVGVQQGQQQHQQHLGPLPSTSDQHTATQLNASPDTDFTKKSAASDAANEGTTKTVFPETLQVALPGSLPESGKLSSSNLQTKLDYEKDADKAELARKDEVLKKMRSELEAMRKQQPRYPSPRIPRSSYVQSYDMQPVQPTGMQPVDAEIEHKKVKKMTEKKSGQKENTGESTMETTVESDDEENASTSLRSDLNGKDDGEKDDKSKKREENAETNTNSDDGEFESEGLDEDGKSSMLEIGVKTKKKYSKDMKAKKASVAHKQAVHPSSATQKNAKRTMVHPSSATSMQDESATAAVPGNSAGGKEGAAALGASGDNVEESSTAAFSAGADPSSSSDSSDSSQGASAAKPGGPLNEEEIVNVQEEEAALARDAQREAGRREFKHELQEAAAREPETDSFTQEKVDTRASEQRVSEENREKDGLVGNQGGGGAGAGQLTVDVEKDKKEAKPKNAIEKANRNEPAKQEQAQQQGGADVNQQQVNEMERSLRNAEQQVKKLEENQKELRAAGESAGRESAGTPGQPPDKRPAATDPDSMIEAQRKTARMMAEASWMMAEATKRMEEVAQKVNKNENSPRSISEKESPEKESHSDKDGSGGDSHSDFGSDSSGPKLGKSPAMLPDTDADLQALRKLPVPENIKNDIAKWVESITHRDAHAAASSGGSGSEKEELSSNSVDAKKNQRHDMKNGSLNAEGNSNAASEGNANMHHANAHVVGDSDAVDSEKNGNAEKTDESVGRPGFPRSGNDLPVDAVDVATSSMLQKSDLHNKAEPTVSDKVSQEVSHIGRDGFKALPDLKTWKSESGEGLKVHSLAQIDAHRSHPRGEGNSLGDEDPEGSVETKDYDQIPAWPDRETSRVESRPDSRIDARMESKSSQLREIFSSRTDSRDDGDDHDQVQERKPHSRSTSHHHSKRTESTQYGDESDRVSELETHQRRQHIRHHRGKDSRHHRQRGDEASYDRNEMYTERNGAYGGFHHNSLGHDSHSHRHNHGHNQRQDHGNSRQHRDKRHEQHTQYEQRDDSWVNINGEAGDQAYDHSHGSEYDQEYEHPHDYHQYLDKSLKRGFTEVRANRINVNRLNSNRPSDLVHDEEHGKAHSYVQHETASHHSHYAHVTHASQKHQGAHAKTHRQGAYNDEDSSGHNGGGGEHGNTGGGENGRSGGGGGMNFNHRSNKYIATAREKAAHDNQYVENVGDAERDGRDNDGSSQSGRRDFQDDGRDSRNDRGDRDGDEGDGGIDPNRDSLLETNSRVETQSVVKSPTEDEISNAENEWESSIQSASSALEKMTKNDDGDMLHRQSMDPSTKSHLDEDLWADMEKAAAVGIKNHQHPSRGINRNRHARGSSFVEKGQRQYTTETSTMRRDHGVFRATGGTIDSERNVADKLSAPDPSDVNSLDSSDGGVVENGNQNRAGGQLHKTVSRDDQHFITYDELSGKWQTIRDSIKNLDKYQRDMARKGGRFEEAASALVGLPFARATSLDRRVEKSLQDSLLDIAGYMTSKVADGRSEADKQVEKQWEDKIRSLPLDQAAKAVEKREEEKAKELDQLYPPLQTDKDYNKMKDLYGLQGLEAMKLGFGDDDE